MIFGVEIDRVAGRYGEMAFAAKDPVIGNSLRLYGEWAEPEIDMLAGFVGGDGCIIDVGANIGTHAIGLANRFPDTPVLAFEPQPLAFALLCANIVATNVGRIEPINAALAGRKGTLFTAYDYESVGWNIGAINIRRSRASHGVKLPVPILTLDAVIGDRLVQLIKIDVEGMEPQVLAGARNTIARCRPVVFFEALTLSGVRRAREALAGLDYEFRWCETPAFNPNNFNQNPENIWGLGESGVLALPTADDPRALNYPLLSGAEKKVPRRAFAKEEPSPALAHGRSGDPVQGQSFQDPETPGPDLSLDGESHAQRASQSPDDAPTEIFSGCACDDESLNVAGD